MIKRVYLQPRVMGTGNKGVAGTKAGAENPKMAAALGLQPIEAAADIDHALSAGWEVDADLTIAVVLQAVERQAAGSFAASDLLAECGP